jgi:hypothetical protein
MQHGMIKNREEDCLAMAQRLALTGDFRDSTDIEHELRFKHGRTEAEEVLDDDRIRSALDQVCNRRWKLGQPNPKRLGRNSLPR